MTRSRSKGITTVIFVFGFGLIIIFTVIKLYAKLRKRRTRPTA